MPARLSLVTASNQDELAEFGQVKMPILERVFDASPNCIKVLDKSGHLLFMNTAGQCAMEIDHVHAISARPWHSLWPEAERDLVAASIEHARRGQTSKFVAFCPTAKGSPRWWEVFVAPVRDADGVANIISVSRDITDAKLAEEARQKYTEQLHQLVQQQEALLAERDALIEKQKLMMREVDHRVKNSLAVVSSILRAQSRGQDELVRRELGDAAGRVQLIADIHDRLHKATIGHDVELAAFVPEICDLSARSAATGMNISTSVAKTTVTPEDAVTIGLAVCEMITNAIRHGLKGQAGNVSVAIDADESGVSSIAVTDDGVGFATGFDASRSKGLGMRLVKAQAVRMGGRIDTQNLPGGGGCIRIERKAL